MEQHGHLLREELNLEHWSLSKLGMPISLALTNTWRLSAVSELADKMKSGFLLRSGATIPPHSDEIPRILLEYLSTL